MGKLTQNQRRERDDRVRRGLDPYFRWAKPHLPVFIGQGFTSLQRRDQGKAAGDKGASAAPLAYNERLANYLHLDPAEVGPATSEARLTPAQRKRLDKKLRHGVWRGQRRMHDWSRARAQVVRVSRRRAAADDPERQAELRLAAWARTPAERAERRREAKRAKRGTHQHRTAPETPRRRRHARSSR